MPGIRQLAFAAIVSLFSLSCSSKREPVPAAVSIEGRITDAESGRPLKNVIVYSDRDSTRTLTDENGRYRLDRLESDSVTLTVLRYGYASDPREVIRVFGEPRKEKEPVQHGVQNFSLYPKEPGPKSSDTAFIGGYELGRTMAEAEFQNNDPCWYFGGLYSGRDKKLERVTGVPMRGVHGCLVDSHIEGFVEGHNDRVLEHIAASGLPAVPRLWEYQYQGDLTAFCTRMGGPDAAENLWSGGPALWNTDSTLMLRLVWPNIGDLKSYLEIKKTNTVIYTELPRHEWDTIHVYWGTAGDARDEVAVLRTGPRDFDLIDLRTGKYRQFYRNTVSFVRPKAPLDDDR